VSSISLQNALLIDLCTLLLCSMIALRCASSFLHPALMTLGCHSYIVTLRLFQLLKGAQPMSYTFVWPVATGEVVRAALASDAALLAMASAWVLVRYWGRRRTAVPREPRILLSFPRVRTIALLTTVAFVAAVAATGPHNLVAEPNTESMSGYLLAATGWAPWAACLLHFIYGFQWPLLCFTAGTLVASLMVSHFRGVVIIPLIFLLFTWLARRKSRRLPLALFPAALCLWLIWLPMKPILYALQTGLPIGDAISAGVTEAFGHFGTEEGSAIDFQFLDMIGSTMSLVDIHGTHLWGGSITPLLVSPVPRSLWPAKPHFNQYQIDLDIPSRNMAALNMTAGLIGECYADFGYFGVLAIPFLISLGFSLAYNRLAGTYLLAPGALLYLIFLSTFMQLYRDGLISGFMFPFVHCAPIGWTALSHWIWPPEQGRVTAPGHSPNLRESPSAGWVADPHSQSLT